ncbi:hypothetical protein F441_02890, partial [Phytophthora nicotianae CJ01A1]
YPIQSRRRDDRFRVEQFPRHNEGWLYDDRQASHHFDSTCWPNSQLGFFTGR